MSSWAFAVSFTHYQFTEASTLQDVYFTITIVSPWSIHSFPRMRALAKKLFCSLVLVAWVRGSATSFEEDLVEEELDKRDTGNITLKAPIIGVVSEDWWVLPLPIRNPPSASLADTKTIGKE
jgi:hypothetical protein